MQIRCAACITRCSYFYLQFSVSHSLPLLRVCQRAAIDLRSLTEGRELPSGRKAVMRQAMLATMLLVAKGRRRPTRSIVTIIRKAAGSSTAPEMKKSR